MRSTVIRIVCVTIEATKFHIYMIFVFQISPFVRGSLTKPLLEKVDLGSLSYITMKPTWYNEHRKYPSLLDLFKKKVKHITAPFLGESD